MIQENNIIAIRKADATHADQAFSELMKKSESMLNDAATKLQHISANDLEHISTDYIKQACSNTPFRAEEVQLVSGHKFPDICIEQFYGVEVKSTIKDKWTSTGSSIVESTRIKNVDQIYMLFGKLGGHLPQFKIRPYADILYDIAVTHSPRYLINMELETGESIFEKMGTTYDKFRTSKDMITMVRKYHKNAAKKNSKGEMPWWISPEESERTTHFNLRLWSTLTIGEKNAIKAMSMILFPEVLCPKQRPDKYNNLSLWLCSYHQIINPNVRDIFSAGGQIHFANENRLKKPIPKIFKNIIDLSPIVEQILTDKESDTMHLIKEFNPTLINANNSLYDAWAKQCITIAQTYKIDEFKDWLNKRVLLR